MGLRPGQGTKSLQDVQHVQGKKKATYTHMCMHVMINVPKKVKLTYNDGSQKVVAGVGGNCGEEQGAGRSTKGLSEGMTVFSTLFGWWLHRSTQLSSH